MSYSTGFFRRLLILDPSSSISLLLYFTSFLFLLTCFTYLTYFTENVFPYILGCFCLLYLHTWFISFIHFISYTLLAFLVLFKYLLNFLTLLTYFTYFLNLHTLFICLLILYTLPAFFMLSEHSFNLLSYFTFYFTYILSYFRCLHT